MIFKIIPITLVLVLLCTADGLKYSYQRYGRFYGKKNSVSHSVEVPGEQQITPKLPNEFNICPQINCPLVQIPEKCRKETFINTYGVLCRGCDQNVCDQNGHFDNSKLEEGSLPIRGDNTGQFNGRNNFRWMDTTPPLHRQNEWQNSLPVHSNIHFQNNVPVWQNDGIMNNQLQNNVPIRAQWQDNVPFNTQWQSNIPPNTQWQNNGLSHSEWINNAPVNNQIKNWQNNPGNNYLLPGNNNQWQNTHPITGNNHWEGEKMKQLTFMGNIVHSVSPMQDNPWERVPFQTPLSKNHWLNNPTFTKIPRDNSLPVYKAGGAIGIPITGLPMQIGKSVEPEPFYMKSDQNLGFTNPFYGQMTFGDIGNNIRNSVYEANSPGGFNSMVHGHLGGKK